MQVPPESVAVTSRTTSKPAPATLSGASARVEPLDPAIHTAALWESLVASDREALFDYLFDEPFSTLDALRESLARKASSADPLFFAIVDPRDGKARGYAALMRVEPTHGVIEVGSILFTPALQRTPGATEAMYLLARHIFEDLGYRRYEWKCDSRNAPSRRAALRLGFQFEGIFRQHMIVKGRNRDTAWYSMLDGEWPRCKIAFERWLEPENFDAEGRQKQSLAAIREALPDNG